MRVGGEERRGDATGDGIVDACYKAIYQLAGIHPVLERYAVKAITGGTDALGEVSCLVRHNGDDGARPGRAQRYRDGQCVGAGQRAQPAEIELAEKSRADRRRAVSGRLAAQIALG